jgi:hypothetical protein
VEFRRVDGVRTVTIATIRRLLRHPRTAYSLVYLRSTGTQIWSVTHLDYWKILVWFLRWRSRLKLLNWVVSKVLVGCFCIFFDGRKQIDHLRILRNFSPAAPLILNEHFEILVKLQQSYLFLLDFSFLRFFALDLDLRRHKSFLYLALLASTLYWRHNSLVLTHLVLVLVCTLHF